ncbi:MAG: GlsB/YeaQ/YmgE family stress response membrane protein [Planctomycetota bacterium]
MIWFLIIGAIAGWLAGTIMKGSGFGILGNIIVGVLGAIVGGFLLELIGFSAYGLIAKLITALIGAVVLLSVAGFIAGKKK